MVCANCYEKLGLCFTNWKLHIHVYTEYVYIEYRINKKAIVQQASTTVTGTQGEGFS